MRQYLARYTPICIKFLALYEHILRTCVQGFRIYLRVRLEGRMFFLFTMAMKI